MGRSSLKSHLSLKSTLKKWSKLWLPFDKFFMILVASRRTRPLEYEKIGVRTTAQDCMLSCSSYESTPVCIVCDVSGTPHGAAQLR